MKIFLVGQAAMQREQLEAVLPGSLELVALPREAGSDPRFDHRIEPDDVVVALNFKRDAGTAPPFRLLHVPGAGLDGIAFEGLAASCTVCNVFEHEGPIAEYVCAVMLEHEIGVQAMRASFSRSGWSDLYRARVPHGELSGKSLLLVGYGRIGRAVAQRARVFGMRIVAVDPFATPDAHLDEMYEPRELHEAVAQADYIAIVCPLNDDTRGMIDAAALAHARPVAMLINVSRAEVAEQADLYAALATGRLAHAALDAWYRYPQGADDLVDPAAQPFWDLPNVICTPHSSAWTTELPRRRYAFIGRNIARLIAGQPLENVVRAATA